MCFPVVCFAIEANQWVAIVLAVVCLAALLIIVVAPWRKVRAEPRLSDEVESRLLLGEDPAEIAEETESESPKSPSSPGAEVLDLDPERRSSP